MMVGPRMLACRTLAVTSYGWKKIDLQKLQSFIFHCAGNGSCQCRSSLQLFSHSDLLGLLSVSFSHSPNWISAECKILTVAANYLAFRKNYFLAFENKLWWVHSLLVGGMDNYRGNNSYLYLLLTGHSLPGEVEELENYLFDESYGDDEVFLPNPAARRKY